MLFEWEKNYSQKANFCILISMHARLSVDYKLEDIRTRLTGNMSKSQPSSQKSRQDAGRTNKSKPGTDQVGAISTNK